MANVIASAPAAPAEPGPKGQSDASPSAHIRERSNKACGAEKLKWFSLVALTFQTTWQVYSSQRPTHTLAVLRSHFCSQPLETLKLGVPALLYTLQNNLLFFSLDKLSAAVQQVTYQLKILTAALLSVVFLGKHLTPVQWIALTILIAGVVLVQFPSDFDFGSNQDPKNVEPTDEALEASFQLVIPGLTSLSADTVLGVGAVLLACLFSGAAGVFMEKTLKQTDTTIWIKNVLLGSFGTLSALVGALGNDGERILDGGFLQGFTWRVWLVVWTLASGGLMVAVVIKYADNILRQFSTAMSIILTSLVSAVVLQDFMLDARFALGALLAIAATFMYNLGLPDWALRIWQGKHLQGRTVSAS